VFGLIFQPVATMAKGNGLEMHILIRRRALRKEAAGVIAGKQSQRRPKTLRAVILPVTLTN
jgi:hypothetical protein